MLNILEIYIRKIQNDPPKEFQHNQQNLKEIQEWFLEKC